MKILVVDDDAALREVLTQLLLDEGFAAQAAADLDTALGALARQPVDVVLTDAFCSVWGDHALDPVRQVVKAARGASVILLTAHAEAALLDPARAGLAAVVCKPFEVDDLLARLRALAPTPSKSC